MLYRWKDPKEKVWTELSIPLQHFRTQPQAKGNMEAIAPAKKVVSGIRFTKLECGISQEAREMGGPQGLFLCGNTTTTGSELMWSGTSGAAGQHTASCPAASKNFSPLISAPHQPLSSSPEKCCLSHAETGSRVSAVRGFQLRKDKLAKVKTKIKKLALSLQKWKALCAFPDLVIEERWFYMKKKSK